jgi:hypothetical protein
MREHKARRPWQLGKLLHVHYDCIVDEPLPDRWVELIRALHDRERLARKKDTDANTGKAHVDKDQ